MSGRPLLAASSSAGAQSSASGSGQKQPERPGGKPKRTLIESACAACRRRKSRCDGARPACSRCQTLQTECQYQAEEGESRWSALRRKNKNLEKERDEAQELIALLHNRPEQEASEIYRQIRMNNSDGNIAALVRQVSQVVLGGMAARPYPQQQGWPQLPLQSTLPPAGAGSQPPGAAPQLPPLRSMVELSTPGTTYVPEAPARVQRNSSLTSAVSDGSYSSMSSSEFANSSMSPRDLSHGRS